jgi:hypothetical protein
MGSGLLALVFVASGVTMLKRAAVVTADSKQAGGPPRPIARIGFGIVMLVLGALVAVYAVLEALT